MFPDKKAFPVCHNIYYHNIFHWMKAVGYNILGAYPTVQYFLSYFT